MTTLADLLITAAADARAATVRGALPPDPVAPSDVAGFLSRLPSLAAAARIDDPDCAAVMIPAHGEGRAARMLSAAAVRALADEGIAASSHAGGVVVSLASLFDAADRTVTARAAITIASAWRDLTGPGSRVDADLHASTLTLSAGPDGRHVAAPGWQGRPVAEVVEEARAALCLPSWRIADVAAAWRARAGAEARCAVKRGIFRGTVFHAADDFALAPDGPPTVSVLCFALRPAAPPAVYALTPATCEADVGALVERAAQALGLPAPSPPAPPARDDRRPLRNRAASL
jgi:hypothetical protein